MNLTMFKLVFSQASLLRSSQGSTAAANFLWGLTSLMLIVAFAFLGLGVAGHFAAKAWMFILFILGFQVFLAWSPLIQVVPQLLTPHYAQLVPRLRSGLIRVIVISWGIAILFFSAGFGVLSGEYLRAGCVVALLLGGLGLIGIKRQEGIFPYMLGLFTAVNRELFQEIDPTHFQLLLLAAAIATSLYAYFRLFPKGERHWASAAQAQKSRTTLLGKIPLEDKNVSAMARRLYGAVLRRDCLPVNRDSGKLMWHALGPGAHWSSPVLSWLVMVMIGVVCIQIATLFGYRIDFWRGLIVGMSSTIIVFGQFWQIQKIAMRLHATRTEQGLVYLTPRMPQNKELRRVFVKRVLWHSAMLFGLVMATSIFAGSIIADSPKEMIGVILLCCVSVLASVGMLRWITGPGSPESVWPALKMLVQMMMVGAFYFTIDYRVPLPLWVFSAMCFIVAGYLLIQDVRKVLDGPKPFPLALDRESAS